MGITKKEQEMALHKWGNMKPISKDKIDWCIRTSAKYIYVDSKGNGWCTKCESKVMLPKTKHLEQVKCPSCGKTMESLHIWRREHKNYFRCTEMGEMNLGLENDRIDWFAFPEVINDHIIMLRYVVVNRPNTEPICGERARLIIDFEKEKEYTLEYCIWNNTWRYTARDYFRESGMGYSFRRWCCLPAQIYPHTIKRINKVKSIEKIIFTPELFKDNYPSATIIHSWRNANLYEKLSKVGMQKFMYADLRSYAPFNYDREQTSLIKMLKLNKNTFNLLKVDQTFSAYNWLTSNPNATRESFDKARLLGFNDYILNDLVKEYGMKYGKTFQYIKKNVLIDYRDYVRTIDQLGYPIDNQYLYPKDFRKADERVQKEYRERENRRRNMTPLEQVKEEARIDMVINKISNALRENEELKRWMVGSNGLKVIVPQSVGELTDEGIKLHNCLKTYARKIADKQSLIFFIRKLNDPSKEYIAMEYANGKIEQIRLDNNVPVKQAEILQFADAFVRKLNQLDIMNELRRAA